MASDEDDIRTGTHLDGGLPFYEYRQGVRPNAPDASQQAPSPAMVPLVTVCSDRNERKIDGCWFFALSYFKRLEDMSKIGVSLFAFGKWFTYDVVDSSFYQRNVYISRGEFRDQGCFPVEYLHGDWLLRDCGELSYVLKVRSLVPGPSALSAISYASRGISATRCPNRSVADAISVTISVNRICLRARPFLNVTELVLFVAISWLDAIYTRYKMYRLGPGILSNIEKLDYQA
eukprot:IDg5473t1